MHPRPIRKPKIGTHLRSNPSNAKKLKAEIRALYDLLEDAGVIERVKTSAGHGYVACRKRK